MSTPHILNILGFGTSESNYFWKMSKSTTLNPNSSNSNLETFKDLVRVILNIWENVEVTKFKS